MDEITANVKLLLWLSGLTGKSAFLDSAMRVVVNDYFIPVTLSLALLGLWFTGQSVAQRERHQKAVICAAISIGITSAIVKILNLLYFEPRPFARMPELLATVQRIFYPPQDSSFPSNAAAITFAIATAVWLGNHRVGYFLIALASLMSLARVYAAAHYPLDVVGGAVIGALTSYLIFRGLRLAEPFPTWVLKLARRVFLA